LEEFADMMKVNVAENLEKVLHFIQNNPGSHLGRIKNELHMSSGAVQYHLYRLEKLHLISSTRRGLYRFYFPYGLFQDNEKDILQILGQETARDILLFIIERKSPTQTEIAARMRISPASVNWQIKRLIALNLVHEIKEGKYKRYKLTKTRDSDCSKHILAMLKNYYPTIWNTWNARWAELFLSFSKYESNGRKESELSQNKKAIG
jgi:predicted transcriptional regulator